MASLSGSHFFSAAINTSNSSIEVKTISAIRTLLIKIIAPVVPSNQESNAIFNFKNRE